MQCNNSQLCHNDDDPKTNQEILDDFCAEWISEIDKDVKRSLAVFLCNVFVKYHGLRYTAAAEMVAMLVGKADKTVRRWRSHFYLTEELCQIANKENSGEEEYCATMKSSMKWQPGMFETIPPSEESLT